MCVCVCVCDLQAPAVIRVDRRGGQRLDGLTGWSQQTLVLDGHLLHLRRRHDALHLRLEALREAHT